ncbi:MAG: YwaF family protein [Clostridia bacterium]|nr:YwaF family protein [Clostridia bacterium]
MLIYTLTIIIATALLVVGAYIANKKGIDLSLVRRIAVLVMSAIAFYRYMIDREAISWVRGLNMTLVPGYEIPFGNDILLTVISAFLIWFTWAALLSIALNEFFKIPTLKNMVKFFSAPVLVFDLLLFEIYARGIIGADVLTVFDSRLPALAIELVLALALSVSFLINEIRSLPSIRELITLLVTLPFAILTVMPTYIPQLLIGYLDSNVKLGDFTEEHRMALYVAVIIPIALFFVFKDRSEDVKRAAMLYITLGVFWSYVSRWYLTDWLHPWNLPLYLCNIAMYIIPLCLIFKWEKPYYFCLFINVTGALISMLVPYGAGEVNALASSSVSFWLNHYVVFFMPLLLLSLKLYKRPTLADWGGSLIIFTVYFFSVLFLNALFENFGHTTDFFYLNSDFIADKIGDWALATRDFVWTFNIGELTLTFYPLYQSLFFIIYTSLTIGTWFIYEFLFKRWDIAESRRLKERDYKQMKKDLLKFLGGKAPTEPVSGDSSPKIVLRGFSKKYGSNKHYSVDHVSFEVKGGEVFGFLGPNGAGKSTIIKSIVGIQTITSGSIEICGYDVDKQPIMAKMNTGFVPDHYALYENLTGREYINYIADLYQVSQEYRDETIEKYVSRFQLSGAFDNQMKTYSHGMKQKIAIMAALVHNPKVWILDEPLTGLDPTSIFEVKECMKEHAAKGNIVFFSSHIIDIVEKICDKIAIIKGGKLRAVATVADLDAQGIDLEELYISIINADENAELININGDDILGVDSAAHSAVTGAVQA